MQILDRKNQENPLNQMNHSSDNVKEILCVT